MMLWLRVVVAVVAVAWVAVITLQPIPRVIHTTDAPEHFAEAL